MTKLRIAPEGELESKAAWMSGTQRYLPEKANKNRAKVAYIGSRHLRETLAYELDVVPVLEGAHFEIIKYSDIDFILIESVFNSQICDWRMQQFLEQGTRNELTEFLSAAKDAGIPTVFWFTLDGEYSALYRNFAALFDRVYCCCSRAQKNFELGGVSSKILLPTFEPALYNPIQQYRKRVNKCYGLVTDTLSDTLDRDGVVSRVLAKVPNGELGVYDSDAAVWQSKLGGVSVPSDAVLGTVEWSDIPQILKQSTVYLTFSDSIKSQAMRQWHKLQAMACRIPVLQYGDAEEDDFLYDWTLYVNDENEFIDEVDHFKKDWLYSERVSHRAWRYVMIEHQVARRVDQLLGDLFGGEPVVSPMASLVMPTIRKSFVARAIEQFDEQTYKNKELVIVWNGDQKSYAEVEFLAKGRPDVTCSFLPGEQSTGDCINYGIHLAKGEYVFKFDDDDFYGQNYLEDLMLYFDIGDFDIIGKPLTYFKLNDESVLYRRNLASGYPLTAFSTKDLSHNKISVSGSTLSGRRSVFIRTPYTNAYRAADSGWYKHANEIDLRGVSADMLNSIFWRRTDGFHTWEWRAENNGCVDECLIAEDLMC